MGSRVKVMTREPVVPSSGGLPGGGGNRHFEGRLERFDDGRLVVNLEGKREKGKGQGEKGKGKKSAGESPASTQVEIELSNVERANLVPEI